MTAYGTIFEAASEAAMLALAAVRGDACVRSDSAAVFLLTGSDPSVIGGWVTVLGGPGGMTALVSATAQRRAAAALAASDDIDMAMPYQGRVYDPDGAITGTPQRRAFPRVAYATVDHGAYSMPAVVWDWDINLDAAIVPDDVLVAWIIQVNDRLDGTRLARRESRAGLTGQSVGSLSESYAAAAQATGDGAVLCDDALRRMGRYRLRQGRLL